MKHTFIVLVVSTLGTSYTYACDACGCSGSLGNMGLGVQMQGNRTSFSFLHSYKHYATTYKGLYGRPDTFSDEYYLKGDFAALVRLSRRLQARFNLPFNYNIQQESSGERTQIAAMGDLQLGLNYFILDSAYKHTIVRWSAGTGIKVPTGKFTAPENENLMLYPGTGTLDYALSSSFALRSGNFGLSNESSYFIRSINKYGYHPGNTFFNQLLGIYVFNKLSIGTGLSVATNASAQLNDKVYEHSNAQAILIQNATVLSYSLNQWSLQLGINIPVYQQLGEEQSKQKEALSFGIYYLLNKAK